MTTPHASTTYNLNWTFSTLGCPELSLEEITVLAKRFNLGQVELRAISDRMDLPVLFAEHYQTPKALRQWLQEHRMEICSLDSSAKLAGCTPEAKAELLQFAEWADALGVPGIRVFDGGQFSPQLEETYKEEATGFLSWWNTEKERHAWKVDLIIETHDALCTAANCLDLAEAATGPVWILWDAHHTWRKAGEDPMQTWASIKPMVRHIHFKDSIDKPSARHPFTYTHLGEGEFPLEALFRQLAQDSFSGPVSLEWERKWHPYLDPLDQALEKLNGWRS